MASEKISAMPSLGGNQVPTDLVPLVDLSAIPASQNVKSTLNDLFAILTKNITDRAVRFSAPGSTPALSAAGAGALYFDGTKFQVSENTGVWASLVVAGLITGSGLTQNTARLLGRTTAGVGAVEEISVGANLVLSGGSLAVTGVALSGLVTASGLTQNTARLLGRTTAGVGAVEEISIGPGLTLTGGVLDATGGGGGTPGGSQYDVQFHDAGGTFGGSNNFQFKPSGNPTVSIRATSASHNVLDLTADVAQTAEVLLIKQDGDNTASLLTLRQGPLSTLNSSFPFRFETDAGALIVGIRSRPAIGSYQFVSPGANNGQVVYELGPLGSNNGLGLSVSPAVAGSTAIYSGGIQAMWWNGSNGNTVVNSAYQLTWSGPLIGGADAGIAKPAQFTLRISDGSTGQGKLAISRAADAQIGNLAVYVSGGINNISTVAGFSAYSILTPAAGFGAQINLQLQTTSQQRQAGAILWRWLDATDATYSGEVKLSVSSVTGGVDEDRLILSNRLTRVPSGIFYAPAIPGATTQQIGQFFGDGSTLYGTFQSATLSGQSYIFFGTNRWSGAGAWSSVGFDSTRPGNIMIMAGTGTNATFTLFYFPGSSNIPSAYASFDRSSTAEDMGLVIWDATAGSTKRVSRGPADSGGTGYRILRILN